MMTAAFVHNKIMFRLHGPGIYEWNTGRQERS